MITAGQRLRGDNAMVKSFPHFFARDADPGDVASVRRQLGAEAAEAALSSAQHDTRPATILGAIPAPHRLRATRDYLATHPAGGTGIRLMAGEVVDGRSEIAQWLRKLEPTLLMPAPADD